MIKKIIAMCFIISLPFNAHTLIAPDNVPGSIKVNTEEAHKLFKQGALFVDVRSEIPWDIGRIPDALHLSLNDNFDLNRLRSNVIKDEPIVVY